MGADKKYVVYHRIEYGAQTIENQAGIQSCSGKCLFQENSGHDTDECNGNREDEALDLI